MPRAHSVNEIEIEYEVLGDTTFEGRPAKPLLMIMGLGAQMVFWDDDLCRQLVERGHRVIRFDNRDVGLSSRAPGTTSLQAIMAAAAARFSGQPVASPYTLSDMASDAVAVLDDLGIDKAHVLGASLGGMIAQTLAIEHPTRVATLTSIMSTTGRTDLPPARPEAMAALLEPSKLERDAYADRMVRVFRVIGSPGFAFDEARLREISGRSFDRGVDPMGFGRQFLAIIAALQRNEKLAQLKIPTLVIHGAEDPLIPVEHGRDTAAAIPGAELMVIEGMGHDTPREVWPRLLDAVSALTARG